MSSFATHQPSSSSRSHNNAAEDDSSDDDYGPALPPSIAAARAQTNVSPIPQPVVQSRPVVGPTLPPSHHVEDDSDGDIGPAPLPSSYKTQEEGEGVKAFLEAEERRRKGLQVSHILAHSSNLVSI